MKEAWIECLKSRCACGHVASGIIQKEQEIVPLYTEVLKGVIHLRSNDSLTGRLHHTAVHNMSFLLPHFPLPISSQTVM